MKKDTNFFGCGRFRAQIIEEHITLDTNMEGTDHKASITPLEFKQMTSNIREIERL